MARPVWAAPCRSRAPVVPRPLPAAPVPAPVGGVDPVGGPGSGGGGAVTSARLPPAGQLVAVAGQRLHQAVGDERVQAALAAYDVVAHRLERGARDGLTVLAQQVQ